MPGWTSVETVGDTFPGFAMGGYLVLAGPAGIPPEILQRANRETAAIVKNPDFVQRVSQYGWYNVGGARTPSATADFVRSQYTRYQKVLNAVGFEPK
jgi:tripartite-type tricarboxylate transporter receptor subunit TctC